MAQQVQAKQEQAREFLEKLLGFRNTLDGRERELFDAAIPVAPAQHASESEVRALAEKVKAFQETLPSEQQRLLGRLVETARGGAEVEAHVHDWDVFDWAAGYPFAPFVVAIELWNAASAGSTGPGISSGYEVYDPDDPAKHVK